MNQQLDTVDREIAPPSPEQRMTLYPTWVWWILIAQVGIGIVNVGLGFLPWDKGIYWIWVLNTFLASYIFAVYQLLGIVLLLSIPFLILRALFQNQKEEKQRTRITVLLSLLLMVMSLPALFFSVLIEWSGPLEHNGSVRVNEKIYRLAHSRHDWEVDENKFMLYECDRYGLICEQIASEWNTRVSAPDVQLIYVPDAEELRAFDQNTIVITYALN